MFSNPPLPTPEQSLRRHQALPGERTVLAYGLKSQGCRRSLCFGLAQDSSEVEIQNGAMPDRAKNREEGEPRTQTTLFPERIEDYIDEENPVRFIDYFVDGLDLEPLGFHGVNPKATGRPSLH